ncbi:MAG: zinc-binding dehydrogenase [Saprospiraceae bacterium]|nr:zinc-binding dehydrogenase [Bacteroidia bacterium]NNE16175.1 zinc-binding dehydrogenase [Saprospiraceae bacterium]NNL91605.1 zinc-binding dehydrogenase [Saprospiraceae bacterium]
MKAIYLKKYGHANKAFEIREAEMPTPGPREVCIKVNFFGINFADVVARRGLYPDAPKNPAIIGYDVTGEIESVGEEITEFKKGDKVAALTRFGGYAEYVTTMIEGVVKLPDGYDEAKATALATQACTAYYCAEECVTLNAGDNVLIQAAAGGVGSILVQIARHHGCTIFGTASTSKLGKLEENGVHYPIDYTKKDFYTEIEKTLGGQNLDFVFDSIGGKVFKKGYKLLQPGGSIVTFGAAAQISGNNKLKALGVLFGFGLFSPIQLLLSSKSLIAVNMLRIADFKPQLFQKIFSGVMDYADRGIINPTVAKVFEADQIAEAHEYVESRKSSGKVVMRW